MKVRPLTELDRARLVDLWHRNHADTVLVTRGRLHDAMALDGWVAEEDGALRGALTYVFENGELEIITLDSLEDNRGSGTALLNAAVEKARALAARRAWLITSNDNIRAIRFYQKRGWNMVAVHRDAITEARRLKPVIPLVGDHDIPLRHEIEFEFRLDARE